MTETVAIDKVLLQAGSLTDGDLSTFCQELVAAINGSSPECASSLRQLYIVIHSSQKQRRLSPQLMEALVNILLSPERSRLFMKVTASLLLTELGPSPDIDLPVGNLPWNDTQIPFILPVILASGYNKEFTTAIAPQVIRWLSTVGFSAEVQARALSAAATLVQCHPDTLTKDHQYVVDCQLGEWLKSASLYQATNPFSRGIFKRDDQAPITELDGQATRNFFTALCLGQYYTDDQLLNIHSFALLQHWFYHTRGVPPHGPPDAPDTEPEDPPEPVQNRSRRQSQAEGRRSRDPSPTPSVATHPLEESAMQYALRILEQFDRKPKSQLDAEVQKACTIDAVGILNQLCQCDRSTIPKIFDAIKRLYGKLSPTVHQRILVTIMQFYLNHSEAVMFDMFPLCELYLGQVVSLSYANSAIAFDTVMFLQDNKETLIHKTQLLTTYFPNLFKILAWNPHCYVTEFAELLPAFLSPTTAIEVFHTLLDLPLLAAALEVSKFSERGVASDPQPGQLISVHLIEKLREPRYKPLFKFILRAEGGKGDTIDRLNTLHSLLNDLTNHPRVVTCADTVPVLLRIYFDVVLSEGGAELASTLVPVVLERARLLYRIAGYQQAVYSVFAEQVVAMFRRHPRLVMDQFSDLVDYVGGIRNITDDEDLFVHIVWVVGEYLCSAHDARCTPDRVAAMFDALETVAYEVSGRRNAASTPATTKTEQYSPRLRTALMSALAKLASRSQDLIPRVVLCLTKLGKVGSSDDAGLRAVSDRASELVSLLQVPNIAAMVLSPHPDRESGRWHTDNSSLPAVLRATSRILQGCQSPPTQSP